MKVLIIGPIIGYNRDREKSQAEYLIKLLTQRDIEIVWASRFTSRIKRATDIINVILKNRDAQVGIIMVFSYGAFIYADISSYIMQRLDIPVIFWLHGGALPQFTDKHHKWVKRVLKRGRLLVAPSGYLAEYFRRLGFRVEIIRNMVFIEDYPFKDIDEPLEPKILWMRTFHPLYNPDMALYTFYEVIKEYPDTTLTMAGVDKGFMNDTMKLAKELAVYSKVNFPGFLDTRKKFTFFKTHHIYLHTNNIDNTPVSVIEAMASGLVVVGTNVGGISFILKHGENSLLVNPGDYRQMAQYVKDLLKGAIDFKKLRENGRKFAINFDAKYVIENWISLIKEMAREKHYV